MFPFFSSPSHYPLTLSSSPFDDISAPDKFLPAALIPTSYLLYVSLSPGRRSCGRGGLRGAWHPEQSVHAERGVQWRHLPTCHDTVWGHQGWCRPGSGQRGFGHGGRPQGEAPAEDRESLNIYLYAALTCVNTDKGKLQPRILNHPNRIINFISVREPKSLPTPALIGLSHSPICDPTRGHCWVRSSLPGWRQFLSDSGGGHYVPGQSRTWWCPGAGSHLLWRGMWTKFYSFVPPSVSLFRRVFMAFIDARKLDYTTSPFPLVLLCVMWWGGLPQGLGKHFISPT